jgi:hypothetical protein
MNAQLIKALKAVTKSGNHVVRFVTLEDVATLQSMGTNDWCSYNGMQVCWSDRGNGRFVIYAL